VQFLLVRAADSRVVGNAEGFWPPLRNWSRQVGLSKGLVAITVDHTNSRTNLGCDVLKRDTAPLRRVGEGTGLEPAASAVTARMALQKRFSDRREQLLDC